MASKKRYCDAMIEEIKRVSIRLPDALHGRLKLAASRDRRSLHGQVLAYIERGLNQDKIPDEGKGGGSG